MKEQELRIRHSCCFFGHRKIEVTSEMVNTLTRVIENLIVEKEVDIFYFGSKSQFDDLCHKVVSRLKETYPHIKRIYVRAANQHIGDGYKDYLLESYEDTYYPEHMGNAGKASYVERNYEMIDKSEYCICYYDENYVPPRRRNSKRDLLDYQPKSGTKIAYEHAEKKGKMIINVND